MNELKPEDVIEKIERMAEVVSNQSEDNLFWDILALLREKDAEIERLRKQINDQLWDMPPMGDFTMTEQDVKRVRDEAITEFAERIKGFYRNLGGKTVGGSVEYHIDQVLREMKGEGNES